MRLKKKKRKEVILCVINLPSKLWSRDVWALFHKLNADIKKNPASQYSFEIPTKDIKSTCFTSSQW
jgi:hypothetical protein